MKRVLLILSFLALLLVPSAAFAASDVSYGLLFMGGLRYDNVRMCVATPAGVKGGPMADVQLVMRWWRSGSEAVTFNLPIMRPILFSSAFDMIQFEPEVNWESYHSLSGGTRIVSGPGLGISFHRGPGYESDQNNTGEVFNAIGPIFNYKMAVVTNKRGESVSTIGGKLFYTPLFADKHSNGHVIGLAFEYQMGF